MPQITKKKVLDAIFKLRESLRRCEHYLEILLEENQKIIKQLKQKKILTPPSGRSALAETELEEEPGYQAVLKIFNVIHQHIFQLEKERGKTPQGKLGRLDLQRKRYLFLLHTTKANLLLIQPLC